MSQPEPTLFTRIIDGELPGHFVWKDERVVAFLTIAPIKPGHVLVVPREEIEHWIDVAPDLLAHLMDVARAVGRAIDTVWHPAKVGLMVAGLEVPHCHVHVLPIETERDLDFACADTDARTEDLAAAADKIRAALQTLGHAAATGDGTGSTDDTPAPPVI